MGELADLGLFRIRPTLVAEGARHGRLFAFRNSNTRAIVMLLSIQTGFGAHNLTPENLSIRVGNRRQHRHSPARKSLYTQTQTPLVPTNAMVRRSAENWSKIHAPTFGKNICTSRDVATIRDTTDNNYGYAAGQRPQGRSFIPVVKKDTASTLTVVRQIEATMPKFKALACLRTSTSAMDSTSLQR